MAGVIRHPISIDFLLVLPTLTIIIMPQRHHEMYFFNNFFQWNRAAFSEASLLLRDDGTTSLPI